MSVQVEAYKFSHVRFRRAHRPLCPSESNQRAREITTRAQNVGLCSSSALLGDRQPASSRRPALSERSRRVQPLVRFGGRGPEVLTAVPQWLRLSALRRSYSTGQWSPPVVRKQSKVVHRHDGNLAGANEGPARHLADRLLAARTYEDRNVGAQRAAPHRRALRHCVATVAKTGGGHGPDRSRPTERRCRVR